MTVSAAAPRIWKIRRAAGFEHSRCPNTNYLEAGRESAEDLSRAIEYGTTLPGVDAAHVIAAGVSTGGFATVALTAQAPPGLVAAISFAGRARFERGLRDLQSRGFVRRISRFRQTFTHPHVVGLRRK